MFTKIFRVTNIVLLLLCLMYFLIYLDRVNINTTVASDQFRKEIPLTETQASNLFALFAYPYLLFQISGGWVADKFGPRRALTICGIIWASATIMTGVVHGLMWMGISRLILGFGEGATFPTATRAMSQWTPAGNRGFAQGITHAFSRLGSAITPPLIAYLIITVSWRMSFITVGIVSLFWALVWALYFRDDPNRHNSITREELATLPSQSKRREVNVPWKRLAM